MWFGLLLITLAYFAGVTVGFYFGVLWAAYQLTDPALAEKSEKADAPSSMASGHEEVDRVWERN